MATGAGGHSKGRRKVQAGAGGSRREQKGAGEINGGRQGINGHGKGHRDQMDRRGRMARVQGQGVGTGADGASGRWGWVESVHVGQGPHGVIWVRGRACANWAWGHATLLGLLGGGSKK